MIYGTDWDGLLLEARSGDLRALSRLVDAASEDLMAAATGVLRRSTRAQVPVEEIFSDSMLAVLREIGTLRATNYVGFRYWFASIARNHVRNKLRDRRKRPGAAVKESDSRDAEPEELSKESQDFLRCALLRLARSHQIAFVLREGFALTWCTIGFVIERREAPAARLIHYRAVQRVKEMASSRPEIRVLASIAV